MESKRQLLSANDDFEPYVAYNRLKRQEYKGITADSIQRFLGESGVSVSVEQCTRFVELYDLDKNGTLTFKEFLEAILPRDNSLLREEAS